MTDAEPVTPSWRRGDVIALIRATGWGTELVRAATVLRHHEDDPDPLAEVRREGSHRLPLADFPPDWLNRSTVLWVPHGPTSEGSHPAPVPDQLLVYGPHRSHYAMKAAALPPHCVVLAVEFDPDTGEQTRARCQLEFAGTLPHAAFTLPVSPVLAGPLGQPWRPVPGVESEYSPARKDLAIQYRRTMGRMRDNGPHLGPLLADIGRQLVPPPDVRADHPERELWLPREIPPTWQAELDEACAGMGLSAFGWRAPGRKVPATRMDPTGARASQRKPDHHLRL